MKKKIIGILMAFALVCSILFSVSFPSSAAATTIYFSSYAVSGGVASVDLTKSGTTWQHSGNLMTHGGDWVAKAISYDMGIPSANQDWSGMDTAVIKVGANTNYTGAQISAVKINGYTINTGTITVNNTGTGQDISVSLANVPNLSTVASVSVMVKSDWQSIKFFSVTISGNGETASPPPTVTPTLTDPPTPTVTDTSTPTQTGEGIPATIYFSSYAVSSGVASTPLTQSGTTWQHSGNLLTHGGDWVAKAISYDMGIPTANQNWSGLDTAVLKVGANTNYTGAEISAIIINGYTINTGTITVTNTGTGQDISVSLANVPNMSSVATVSVMVKSNWQSIKFFSVSVSGVGATTPPPTTPPPTTPPPTTPPPTTPPPTTPPPTTPPPPADGLTVASIYYDVNVANATIKDVSSNTTVTDFLSKLSISSTSTMALYKDNGFSQKIGSDIVETDNILTVTASDGSKRSYTITVIDTTGTTNYNDTFDDAAGNNALSCWAIIGSSSFVDEGSGNKSLKLTGIGNYNRAQGSLNGNVRIEMKISIANVTTKKSVPIAYFNSTKIGEVIVQNGQLLINDNGTFRVISGGSSISANTWYVLNVEFDITNNRYMAYIGQRTYPLSYYPMLAAATGITSNTFDLPDTDSNGIKLDYLKAIQSSNSVIPAAASSIARITSSYYSVVDQGNTSGTITVYNGTTVGMMKSKITAIKSGQYKVYASDGITEKTTGNMATGDIVKVTAADNIENRTYTVSSTINHNATVTSMLYTVDDAASTISNVDIDTVVEVFSSALEQAQGAVYTVRDANNNTKANNAIVVSGDKVVVTAQDGTTVKTYTIQLSNVPIQTKFYVNPTTGLDSNNGSINSPFQTIQKAQLAVRAINSNMTGNIIVYLRGGTYRLTDTINYGLSDSGTNGYNVIYKAYSGETVNVTGGQQITGWTLYDAAKGIYRANAQSLAFRQLYVNGNYATRARTPNIGTYSRIIKWDQTNKKVIVSNADVPSFTNSTTNPVEMVAQVIWADYRFRIASVERNGDTANIVPNDFERNIMFNKGNPFKDATQSYHLENAYAFLDTPGEWYLDIDSNQVYYMPLPGEDMSTAQVIAPKVETLVKVAGTLDNPVHNITFQGIVFEHSNWTKPNQYGHLDHQDNQYVTRWGAEWQDYVFPHTEAAFVLYAAKNVQLQSNTFKDIGSIAIDIYYGSQDNIINGNAIMDIAGNGIQEGRFYTTKPGGDVDFVWNPTDMREITKNNHITNNFITRVGRDYKGAVAITCGFTQSVLIENNEIIDVPYSGINCGWGWKAQDSILMNNIIRNNHIMHTGASMSDGAGIYTLSKQPGTIIEGNFIQDIWLNEYAYQSNALAFYFDEGSSYITLRNNVFRNTEGFINGDPITEHVMQKHDIIENNYSQDPSIIANAGLLAPYLTMREAPVPSQFPCMYNTDSLSLGLSYAPGWLIYYTTDGSTPTINSPVLAGDNINITGTKTIKAIAISPSGKTSNVFTGVYSKVNEIKDDFGGSTQSRIVMYEGHSETIAQSPTTHFGWGSWAAKQCDPIPGDTDITILINNANNGHGRILFIPWGTNVTGNSQGSYVYTIFSSTGGNTPTTNVPNMQNGKVILAVDGGAGEWNSPPYDVPWPEKLRLTVRDKNGDWYLSTLDTAVTVYARGNITFDFSKLQWQKLSAANIADMNQLDSDAGPGALVPESQLSTPDLSQLTGGGVYVESSNSPNSYLDIQSIIWRSLS